MIRKNTYFVVCIIKKCGIYYNFMDSSIANKIKTHHQLIEESGNSLTLLTKYYNFCIHKNYLPHELIEEKERKALEYRKKKISKNAYCKFLKNIIYTYLIEIDAV